MGKKMEFLEELILSRDDTICENEFRFISDRLFKFQSDF